MQILEGHEGCVHALLFSPASGSLFSAGKDGTLRCWDAWGECESWSEVDVPLKALALSSDGRLLAVGKGDGIVQVWNIPERRLEGVRPTSGFGITGLVFLANDAALALSTGGESQSASESPGIRFWDWRGSKVRGLPAEVSPNISIRALSGYSEKRLLAWVTETRSIVVWNSLRPDPVRFHLKTASRALAFASDGQSLAATQDWKILLFDLEQKRERLVLSGHKGIVSALAYSPDGRHLMSGSWDKTVKVWDARSGREIASFEWPVGRVDAIGYASDGMRAAAAGDTGKIVIWDVDY